MSTTLNNLKTMNLIDLITTKFNRQRAHLIKIGCRIKVSYLIPEGEKERLHLFEGIIIAKQNRGINKTFTLRRTFQGIGIEQIFLINSPKIISLITTQNNRVKRAKLYYLRQLKGKSKTLKPILIKN
jgi:large subunit ribosomal protein L19